MRVVSRLHVLFDEHQSGLDMLPLLDKQDLSQS